jgi:predicted ABC-type ATPase
VQFKAGNFAGSGEIVGEPGADGAHVKDASGRTHPVRWSEITGHDDKGGAEKPKVESEVRGEQKPVPADKFKAADYAKQHDDPNVTSDDIVSHFPADTKDKIADVQERLKSIEQTIDQHKEGEGYSAKRAQLHTKIFEHFLSPERVKAAIPADGEKPTFTILGGRGGSGKSWFKGKVYDGDKAIVLDADEIKGMLPEYEGWNAHTVHEESSDILKNLIKASRKLGLNVVLDGTLNTSQSAIQKVKEFKDSGYRIEAHYMHLPRQEAAKRAVSRFLGKTNRYVPTDVVLANRNNEANFDEVRKHADKWSFRDNNVEHGQEPKLISEGASGESDESQGKKTTEPLTKSEQALILMVRRK